MKCESLDLDPFRLMILITTCLINVPSSIEIFNYSLIRFAIKNPDMQKEEESHYSDTQQGTNCLSGSKLSLFCAK